MDRRAPWNRPEAYPRTTWGAWDGHGTATPVWADGRPAWAHTYPRDPDDLWGSLAARTLKMGGRFAHLARLGRLTPRPGRPTPLAQLGALGAGALESRAGPGADTAALGAGPGATPPPQPRAMTAINRMATAFM